MNTLEASILSRTGITINDIEFIIKILDSFKGHFGQCELCSLYGMVIETVSNRISITVCNCCWTEIEILKSDMCKTTQNDEISIIVKLVLRERHSVIKQMEANGWKIC